MISARSPFSLILNQDNSTKSIFANYCDVLSQDLYLSKLFRFNLFENMIVVKGAFWNLTEHALDESDILHVRKYVNILHQLDNEKNVISAIKYNARLHPYNPLVDRLKSLKWDGVPRIHRLLPRYLGAEESEYTTTVTLMLLHGAIQRIMNPGVKFDNCVIFADKMQKKKKSTLCRFLSLEDKYFCDDLRDLDDSDKAYRKIRTSWIVELAEMVATRNAKTVESIKAFLSQTCDVYTEKYAIVTETIPRHSVFIGTTNKTEFLPSDPTGNRRFFPVICNGKKAEVHPMANEAETRAFIEACYAEAIVTGVREGWTLTMPDELLDELERIREGSSPDDTRIPVVQQWLDDHPSVAAVCTRMIYFDILHHGDGSTKAPEKWELSELAEIMNLHIRGWKKYRSPSGDDRKRVAYYYGDYGVQRAWVRDIDSSVDSRVDKSIDSVDKGGFSPANQRDNPF